MDKTLNKLSKVYHVDHPMADEMRISPTDHDNRFADVIFYKGTRVFYETVPEFNEYAVTLTHFWTFYRGVPMHKAMSFLDIHKTDKAVRTRANKKGA